MQSSIPFPPPNIDLHPDDANNKTFIAMAKAFLSVDNRAMTIKDIASMVGKYGLTCINNSAAAQSITTYLRQHKSRCEQQDDQPLLLSHALSGTPADDDLVPALHSRFGGDSHPLPQDRLTNFRKGTAVWYLSRATGAPCPFARAGIRLTDYACPEDDRSLKQFSKKQRHSIESEEVICGQKRKRPLRGCPTQLADDASDVEERPPKVKLTLRLKPLLNNRLQSTTPISSNSSAAAEGSSRTTPIDVSPADEASSDSADDEEDSMSVDSSDDYGLEPTQTQSSLAQPNHPQEEEPWSLPPYPRRSISIPAYTPSVEPSYSTFTLPPSEYRNSSRRSPSLPYSAGSEPPESEDETDGFYNEQEDDAERSDEDEADLGWEADLDSEGDGDTMWESPGPRSPSAPLVYPPSDVAVKEEPTDLQGILDVWDNIDSSIAGSRFVSKAVDTVDQLKVKIEATDPWDLDAHNPIEAVWSTEEPRIKQEDLSFDTSLPGPSSPLSPISSLSSQFSAFTWSDGSSPPQASDEEAYNFNTIRPRSRTMPTPFSIPEPIPPVVRYSVSSGSSTSSSREASVPSTNLASLLQSMTVNTSTPSTPPVNIPPPSPCVAPCQTRCLPTATAEKIVVHTSQPTNPAITAVHMDHIPVYQMMLGAFQLLRRIDTDFVNLSPIVAYSGTAGVSRPASGSSSRLSEEPKSRHAPSSLASLHPGISTSSSPSNFITNATVITSGSSEICGTWVPLAAAQAYVRDHLAGENAGALELFLSDRLVEMFPPAMQELHHFNASVRALKLFGPHFPSTLMVEEGLGVVDCAVALGGRQPRPVVVDLKIEQSEPLLSLGIAPLFGRHADEGHDAPLSKTEQDLFHELCVIPHDEASMEDAPLVEAVMQVETLPPTPTTAKPAISAPSPAKRHSRASSISSMSSLSSDDDTLSKSTTTVIGKSCAPTPIAAPSTSKSRTSAINNRPLRRSKRVADALASTQPTSAQSSRSARTRKGGSRNSLS